MIFFILMYTMSQVDARKYAAVANSLSVVLTGQVPMSVLETAQGPSHGTRNIRTANANEGPGPAPAQQGELDEIKQMINEFIKTKDHGHKLG
jgi:chemotaxis protein MotB